MALDANGNYYAHLPDPPPPATVCSRKWCVGDGAPTATDGQEGSLWVNRITGDVYEKVNGAWSLMPGGGGMTGVVDPNGSVTASPGAFYYNTVTGSLWVKATGSGTNTGWVALIV